MLNASSTHPCHCSPPPHPLPPLRCPPLPNIPQVFTTRKMSPVFTAAGDGGAGGEVPPVFVDRFGVKGWTSHCGGQDNKVEHALMLQRINTCDENGERGAGTGGVGSGLRTNELKGVQ